MLTDLPSKSHFDLPLDVLKQGRALEGRARPHNPARRTSSWDDNGRHRGLTAS